MVENNEYKVIIPTAGVGYRLGNHCDHVNKTLVSVANRPIISYIIDRLPKNIEIIIDLGHKGELVKEFLTLAYPDREFTFIWAKGKGLTLDLCDYENILQCPFIFFTNDAIVMEDIPPPDHDWIGYSNINAGNDYRSVIIDSWNPGIVKDLAEKSIHPEAKSYIGICGIYNYNQFWRFMKDALKFGTINQGESFALSKIVKMHTVRCKEFTWYDTGTIEALNYANKNLSKSNDPYILPKTEEHIWFCNNRVIKFSTDKDYIAQRVKRARLLDGYVPKIENYTRNMFSYRQVPGKVLSQTITLARFQQLISWLEKFWKDRHVLTTNTKEIYRSFYQDKTNQRVGQYFERFGYVDEPQIINDMKVPTIKELLDNIDWSWISNGVPVRFHGDLHLENILDTGDNFCLLDWRQNFGGMKDYGDIYYDFAKILHGLIVSHGIISKELFNINVNKNIVNFDLLRRQILIDCELWFERYIITNNYDYYKVKVITALIYLNIAALHHQPYAEMLFHLGKLMLSKLVREKCGSI